MLHRFLCEAHQPGVFAGSDYDPRACSGFADTLHGHDTYLDLERKMNLHAGRGGGPPNRTRLSGVRRLVGEATEGSAKPRAMSSRTLRPGRAALDEMSCVMQVASKKDASVHAAEHSQLTERIKPVDPNATADKPTASAGQEVLAATLRPHSLACRPCGLPAGRLACRTRSAHGIELLHADSRRFLLHRSGASRARARNCIRPIVATRRPCRAAEELRRLFHDAPRSRAVAVRKRQWDAARLFQRVPSSRRPESRRVAAMRGDCRVAITGGPTTCPVNCCGRRRWKGRAASIPRRSVCRLFLCIASARCCSPRSIRPPRRSTNSFRASRSAAHRSNWNGCATLTTRTYPVSANWKVYVDNFLEGYHIPLRAPWVEPRDRLPPVRDGTGRTLCAAVRACARRHGVCLQRRLRRRTGLVLLALPKHHAEHLTRGSCRPTSSSRSTCIRRS